MLQHILRLDNFDVNRLDLVFLFRYEKSEHVLSSPRVRSCLVNVLDSMHKLVDFLLLDVFVTDDGFRT